MYSAPKELIAENSFSEWSTRFIHPISNGSLKERRFVTGRDDSQTRQINRRKKCNNIPCFKKDDAKNIHLSGEDDARSPSCRELTDRRLVSSVDRAPYCSAGGRGFEPQTGPTLRVLK